MGEAIERLRRAFPGLAQHLAEGVRAPSSCDGCPLATNMGRAPAGLEAHPAVNYHHCALLGREQWAPEPGCTDDDWLERTVRRLIDVAPWIPA